MKIYCQKCGNANEYSLQKPKFCQNCGEPFNAAEKRITISKKTFAKDSSQERREDDDDYDDDYEFPPNFSLSSINGLDVEIEKPTLNSIRLDATADNKIKLS